MTLNSLVFASAPSALLQCWTASDISAVWNWIAAAGALDCHSMTLDQLCALFPIASWEPLRHEGCANGHG